MRDPEDVFAACWSPDDTGDSDDGRLAVLRQRYYTFRGRTGLRRTETVSGWLADVMP